MSLKIEDLRDVKPHAEGNAFYVTFADLMMLLCVFFVLLLAMSKVETGLFERIKMGITGTAKGTLVELAANLEAIANGDPGVPGVKVRMAADGVRLDLDTAALFTSGSAVLKEDALAPLEPLLMEIVRTPYTIDIEGHTDDTRLHRMVKGELETNWSLSGRRASAVLNYLRESGFRKKRLRVVGYADTRPIVEIVEKKGAQLKKARSKNRRVSILVK